MQRAEAIVVRPVADSDGAPVAALIADCFGEYDGCVYEPSEFPELDAPATWYAPKGTRMWVAEEAGVIVGCICATPRSDGAIELHKFYVVRALRGSGLAHRLTGLFFATARAERSGSAFLWTDTRFTRAHRFYEKLGFRRTGATRRLDDVSDTTEFHYVLTLDGA
jgi:putative acetyltransferase